VSERIVSVTEPEEPAQEVDEVRGLDAKYTKDEIAARWRVTRQQAAVSQQKTVLLRRQTEALAKMHAGLTELELINAEMEALEIEALPPEPAAIEDPGL
jgi:hypothetical protein